MGNNGGISRRGAEIAEVFMLLFPRCLCVSVRFSSFWAVFQPETKILGRCRPKAFWRVQACHEHFGRGGEWAK